jgi:hypothetical protein
MTFRSLPRGNAKSGTILSKTKSQLDWGDEFAIWGNKRYGWSHMLGINSINICFIDEIEAKNKVSLCIEPSRFSSCRSLAPECASAFFFSKNEKTGKIDLTHCFRKPYQQEIRTTYSNCTYFGHATVLNQMREESVFEMTCTHRDVQFFLGMNFKEVIDYKEIVDSINRLIQNVLLDCIDESPLVIPICTIIDNYDGLGVRLLRGIESSTHILDIYPPYCIDNIDIRQCASEYPSSSLYTSVLTSCNSSFSFDYAVHYPSPCHIDRTMIEVQSAFEKEGNEVTAFTIVDEPIIVIARYSFVRFSDITIIT